MDPWSGEGHGVWKIEQISRCCKEKKTNFILDKSEEAGSHWQAPRHTHRPHTDGRAHRHRRTEAAWKKVHRPTYRQAWAG